MTIEPGYWCPQFKQPVQACQLLCPNRIVDTGLTDPTWDEVCDDGNTANGDGCTSDCLTMELGWTCLEWQDGSNYCRATCHGGGDATVNDLAWLQANVKATKYPVPYSDTFLQTFAEACDDGNSADNDGCSANCKTIEPGYACPTPGSLC